MCFCALPKKQGTAHCAPQPGRRRQRSKSHREGVALRPEPPGLLPQLSTLPTHPSRGPAVQDSQGPARDLTHWPRGLLPQMGRAGVSAAALQGWRGPGHPITLPCRVGGLLLPQLPVGRPSSAGLWGPGGTGFYAEGRKKPAGDGQELLPMLRTSSGKAGTLESSFLVLLEGIPKGCSPSGKKSCRVFINCVRR